MFKIDFNFFFFLNTTHVSMFQAREGTTVLYILVIQITVLKTRIIVEVGIVIVLVVRVRRFLENSNDL